mmetsp:Transcript_18136/g.45686  ORF Transcript_18136/g.45686 Transcript_18136/m.45686 type:complete len:274 (+) Transcript_18136:1310-2131(+)
MTVLRGISLVMTPPTVSMPRDRGATSSSRMSFTSSPPSPPRMPPCTAAPYATASSGLMPLLGSLPSKNSRSRSCTLGMRVEPPTSTISSRSLFLKLASSSAFFTGPMVLRNRSMFSSSKRARVMEVAKSMPSNRESSSMEVCAAEDRVRLERSQAVRRRRSARADVRRSFLYLRWNSEAKWFTRRSSKSSPPKWVSPAVALTSKMPSSMVSRDTSKVPPPRSKMSTLRSPWPESFLSRPYAMAAAVGSLMMRSTSRPAILPASLVAWRWESLK